MVNFEKNCKCNTTLKRAFPGATASQLKFYVKPSLLEDNPDIVIINIGTNNLTKKRHQNEQDIFNEIMEVVNECRQGGVNDIFVCSITSRPSHQEKINSLNSLLLRNAFQYDYHYIENSNIKPHHLWRDQLHLNNAGVAVYTNNILEHVNRSIVYNSKWD